MTSEEKKAFLLLKSVIFHYHGLDEDEQKILDETAKKYDAEEELKWANEFIANDYISAFERAREYLNKIIGRCRAKGDVFIWLKRSAKAHLANNMRDPHDGKQDRR